MTTLAKNIDTSKIEFFDVKTLPSGMEVLNYKYDDGRCLSVQSPEMFVPFNVSDYNDDNKYCINLSFGSSNKSEKKQKRIQEFKDSMKKVEDNLIDHAFKNQKAWFKFKKLKTREVLVEDHFSGLIKRGKDKPDSDEKYDDMFKISVKTDTRAQTKSGENITFDDLLNERLFDAVCVFRLTGCWISKSLKKFGFFTKLDLVQVSPVERVPLTIQTYDSDTEEDDLDSDVDSM